MADAALPLEEVFITHIESPTRFFVVTVQKLPMLDAIWQEIEKEIEKEESPSSNNWLSLGYVQPFTPCIAEWQGRWYRARVISRLEDGKLKVLYVDYGNTETVDPEHVKKRPVNQMINSKEDVVWPCRFSGDAARMSKDRFTDISAETTGRFRMHIDDVDDETSQFIVTLYVDGEIRHTKSVNELIMVPVVSPPIPAWQLTRLETASARRTHLGPISGRLLASALVRCTTVYEPNRLDDSGEMARKESEFPLVDLSEDSSAAAAGTSASGCATKDSCNNYRSMSRFVSDLDAVLDGPADETDSEEEDDECRKHLVSAGHGMQHRSQASVSGLMRRSWSMSSDSGQSLSIEDEVVKALKQKWSHVLSLHYGMAKPPPPGSLCAEQQVTLTRIISPTEFYAQTVHQRNGLRRLETSMSEAFNPDQAPIPAPLLSPGLCCGVYSDISKTWRRAHIVRIERDVSVGPPHLVADVFLVDTGFERRFPATALKPLNEHFTTYLPLVFYVKLSHPYFDGVRWMPEDIEKFRQMAENRMLIMKFMTNTPPIFDVELMDLMHNCNVCSNRVKKCTINDCMIHWIQQNGGLAKRM